MLLLTLFKNGYIVVENIINDLQTLTRGDMSAQFSSFHTFITIQATFSVQQFKSINSIIKTNYNLFQFNIAICKSIILHCWCKIRILLTQIVKVIFEQIEDTSMGYWLALDSRTLDQVIKPANSSLIVIFIQPILGVQISSRQQLQIRSTN